MTKRRNVVLVFLGLFLLVFSLGRGVMEGCYYYPDSDLYCMFVSEEDAAADYEEYEDYFSPGKVCSKVDTCEIITCNVNCEDVTKGECEEEYEERRQGVDAGWEEITPETYNEWCSAGCCRAGEFCHYVEGKWECLRNAMALGLDIEVWDINIFSEIECSEQICGIEILPATLKGYVLDEEGSPISEARVEIEEIEPHTTGSDGYYGFEGLSPDFYLVMVSADGYKSASESISLGVDEILEFNFVLEKAIGVAELSGYVWDMEGNKIEGAKVSWEGETEGFILTDETGFYNATGLVLESEYIFKASKYGFAAKEELVTLIEISETKNFTLEEAALQGVEGEVWLDIDSDGAGDELVYGASVYIDGIFRGYSQYEPSGYYEFDLAAGEHEIYAAYLDYELKEKIDFVVEEGEKEEINLVLTKYVGECSVDGPDPTKNVEIFSAEHVSGEKKVLLEWSKPCPEVLNYLITKYRGEEKIDEWSESPAAFSYVDENVEWGESYKYEIIAVYGEARYSETPAEYPFTLGDRECEGKYHEETGWETFCLAESEKRNKVWKCTDENKLDVDNDCSELEPGIWYCAQISGIKATCKDTSGCEGYIQEADPFGLYYEKQKCYGVTEEEISKEDTQNYCYFDYTDTIVDRCGSCMEINSCFDYQSKDACEINNCFGTECKWVDGAANEQLINYDLILPGLVTLETGHGYCVEEDYEQDDKCGLCGPEAELFENYYCTAEICSELGRCFSKAGLNMCLACGEKPTKDNNCYAYSMELECIGKERQPLEVDELREVVLSKDRCSWERCVWQGNPGGAGSCVKDGDGDGAEDCEHLPLGEQLLCRMDNQAPTTEIIPEGVNIISYAHPSLTFRGVDQESKMGVLAYCLANAESNIQVCINFEDNVVSYPGRSETEEIVLDLINATLKDEPPIPGETYRLRYYSKDEYFNQESVKETFVFVDTELPKFEINEMNITVGDTTDLTVFLGGLNEPMDCDFELGPVLPTGEQLTRTVGREETNKEVLFEDLKGVIYNLTVSCVDDYGNVNNKSKEYTFDLEQGISIIHPSGPINEMSIAFEVKTLVGASCELYEIATGSKIAGFNIIDEEGKHHQTEPISGFSQGDYTSEYRVVCVELLTQELLEDYFDFEVDFTGPETQIVIMEGVVRPEARPVEPGWEEIFVESAWVSFECGGEGFECDKTYYCLTENDYETKISPCYVEYAEPFMLNDSTNICYYSSDLGGNGGYPICGRILFEGYGITLIDPEPYWYGGEIWGISNAPIFDWEVMTKIPTQECKFDWIEESNYSGIPDQRKFDEKDNYWVIEGFPEETGAKNYTEEESLKTVYVRCKDLEGVVGPTQKINLEYDPTAPEILEAYAEPDPVYDGNEVSLYIGTDDKTLCRYDEGEKEYTTMAYPLGEGDVLEMMHEFIHSFSFDGFSKTYELTTQCKNGAGDLSEVENLTFFVDYSVLGNIMGREVCVGEVCYKIEEEKHLYIASTDVVLRVLTNKNAVCEYDGGVFEVTGGTEHTKFLSGLSEEEHVYLVNCRIGEEEREGQIIFTVDLTGPVINEVNDQNISCDLDETPDVYVFTDEESISGYYYELYDKEDGILVKNGTIWGESFEVSADLVENNTYYFKVRGVDTAGNQGAFKESDGFLAVPKEDVRCDDDEAPTVIFVITNESCTRLGVEMHCEDKTTCDELNYGKSFVSELCNVTETYWQKILFEEDGWICYYVEDVMGNNESRIRKIDFPDEDGDGVLDGCDICPDTGAGEAVDGEGCAYGEFSEEEEEEDADGDGLPDYWEKKHDEMGCELDWVNDDSDEDGIFDTDEDYDYDGYDNYDEYMAGYDPCEPDAPPVEAEEVEVIEEMPEIPYEVEEEVNVLAWVLLVLGLLMVLGGSSYLVYYYKFAPKVPVKPVPAVPPGVPSEVKRVPGIFLRKRLLALRKARKEKIKAQERENVFRGFGKESREIPHMEGALKRRVPQLRKLDELAKEHAEVRGMVEPGLRYGEKGVFARLDNIAEQTKEKKIEEVVSKKEAKDIFGKLKEISKKRKKVEE